MYSSRKLAKGGSRINQGGRAGGTRFFFERVVGYGRNFFVWVGGCEKNSNSCLVGSLSNRELFN